MRILSYNPGHDGAIALVENANLLYSIEAEKDSNYRYAAVSVDNIIDAVSEIDVVPDVICKSGWWPRDHHEFLHGSHRNGGYRGLSRESAITNEAALLGGRAHYFSSSHERAHIMCAFGMSPIPKRTPCYALVWEGEIGAFYEIDGDLNIRMASEVLSQPGNRYGLLYGLADPTFPKDGPYPRASDAGKLMALASYSVRDTPTDDERQLLSFLLDRPFQKLSNYERLAAAPHLNVGLESTEFRNFAGIYSNAIFDRFHNYAEKELQRGRPLLIAGGCGLNCDWNRKWQDSGLFSEVFVPPVANDSGSAIGTAIDAQYFHTGNPKVRWTVYSGLPFRDHVDVDLSKYDVFDKDLALISDMLANHLILGWVSGRYEIGPRALGNRSIIAAPFHDETRFRLNTIKQREQFRPIAPVCLREDAEKWFGCSRDSPHMLYTYISRTKSLSAVTHVNGTARLQTVTHTTNQVLHELLVAFKARTGYGVLCNTSLNFKGKGCINNMTDLCAYAEECGLDGFVVEGRAYLLRCSPSYARFTTELRRSASSRSAVLIKK